MQLGRIDPDTTANIGIIHGGEAINIVPATADVFGEVRSFCAGRLKRQTEHMCACMRAGVERFRDNPDSEKIGVECEIMSDYPLMHVPEDAPVLLALQEAAASLGQRLEVGRSGGGSDANIFNSRGIVTLNLATGMNRVHSTDEYIRVVDLESVAALVLEWVRTCLRCG
jgi:tripeptide aminopeptidase